MSLSMLAFVAPAFILLTLGHFWITYNRLIGRTRRMAKIAERFQLSFHSDSITFISSIRDGLFGNLEENYMEGMVGKHHVALHDTFSQPMLGLQSSLSLIGQTYVEVDQQVLDQKNDYVVFKMGPNYRTKSDYNSFWKSLRPMYVHEIEDFLLYLQENKEFHPKKSVFRNTPLEIPDY